MERRLLEAVAGPPAEVVRMPPIVKRYYPASAAAAGVGNTRRARSQWIRNHSESGISCQCWQNIVRDASKARRAASLGVSSARPPNTSTATAPANIASLEQLKERSEINDSRARQQTLGIANVFRLERTGYRKGERRVCNPAGMPRIDSGSLPSWCQCHVSRISPILGDMERPKSSISALCQMNS